jgi:pimeloyl-ACP methyl ester carboxylesterase
MTIVFVHGVPETAVIWRRTTELLDADGHRTVCLSPPGFGAPLPSGFNAARVEYCEWLVRELEAIGEPVHLVGHDWGGGHVMAVAMQRPDLLRSWCIDVAGLFHPDYVWHDAARTWQTPGDGEAMLEAWKATEPIERSRMFQAIGLDPLDAVQLAEGLTDDMVSCILRLYRSAAQPAMRAAGADIELARTRPGLVIIAEDDPFVGTPAMATEMAHRAGAATMRLPGLGHWWMIQSPATAAAIVTWITRSADATAA